MTVFTSAKSRLISAGHGNQVGNALNALSEHVVGNFEGFHHRGALGHHLQQAVVGNDHQGIHPLHQILDAAFGVFHALFAFKKEGLGDDAYGQTSQIARHFRHDGRGARARSAAHARRDEHQIRPFEHLGNFFAAFLGSPAADIRDCAGAQALGQFIANLQAVGRERHGQRLLVGVDGNKFHAAQALFHHAVDGVAARASTADDLNGSETVLFNLKLQHCHPPQFLYIGPPVRPRCLSLKQALKPVEDAAVFHLLFNGFKDQID